MLKLLSQCIETIYRAIEDQGSRDVLLLHAKLGLHESEVQRIAAREGKISLVPGHPIIVGTVKFVHKSGWVHMLSLDEQALAAAQRGLPPADAARHRKPSVRATVFQRQLWDC